MSAVSYTRDAPSNGSALRSIEVFHDAARTGDYDAVVVLHGEHDVATCEAVRVALAPLYGVVLLDLVDCSFVDATVMGAVLDKVDSLDRLGYRLELRLAPGPSAVTRLLEVLEIDARIPAQSGGWDA